MGVILGLLPTDQCKDSDEPRCDWGSYPSLEIHTKHQNLRILMSYTAWLENKSSEYQLLSNKISF